MHKFALKFNTCTFYTANILLAAFVLNIHFISLLNIKGFALTQSRDRRSNDPIRESLYRIEISLPVSHLSCTLWNCRNYEMSFGLLADIFSHVLARIVCKGFCSHNGSFPNIPLSVFSRNVWCHSPNCSNFQNKLLMNNYVLRCLLLENVSTEKIGQ